jgi:hypothetical protein
MQSPSKFQCHFSQKNPKTHLATQKTPNSQRNTEQKEQCWRYHNELFEIIPQGLGMVDYTCNPAM